MEMDGVLTVSPGEAVHSAVEVADVFGPQGVFKKGALEASVRRELKGDNYRCPEATLSGTFVRLRPAETVIPGSLPTSLFMAAAIPPYEILSALLTPVISAKAPSMEYSSPSIIMGFPRNSG